MYAEERQQAIADEVRRIGRASVADLAGRFSVTSETVRRDLALLGDDADEAGPHSTTVDAL